MSFLIDVRDLKKVFGAEGATAATVALDGVTLRIHEGEFVSIMGPSGSGKSTLLHILGFLDRQTSGTYLFEGKEINDYSDERLAHIRNSAMGFVFQSFNLLPRATVLENVRLPLYYSDTPEAQWNDLARKAIDSVGLGHRVKHLPNQLSGGEKQRVAIARALVNNPRVIFADEPTGNLDSKSGGQIMELIAHLHTRGHTIILVTHESYTARYADRIITLKDGRIESDASVSDRYAGKTLIK